MSDSLDVTKFNDHELLLVLHTKFDVMRDDMKEIRDGTTVKLNELDLKTGSLEANKASKVDVGKLEERLGRVETRLYLIIGGLTVVNFLIPFIAKRLFE